MQMTVLINPIVRLFLIEAERAGLLKYAKKFALPMKDPSGP